MPNESQGEPHVFHTQRADIRDHFETYRRNFVPEFSEDEYEGIRGEIADFYNIPGEHVFVVPDEQLVKKRAKRAFSIVILRNGDSYYIDSLAPHAVMMRRLQNEHKVPFDIDDDENYSSLHGFLDPEGFIDIPQVQEVAQKRGKPIYWFLRYHTSPERNKPSENFQKLLQSSLFIP